MFVLLFASFIVIFIFTDISDKALRKYPLVDDCTKLLGAGDDDLMQRGAVLDYLSNSALEEDGRTVSYTKGYVQCFCDSQALKGDLPDQTYTFHEDEIAVCQDYFDSTYTAFILSNAIMGVIVGINVVLKMITIKLITWIGYDTHSELMTKITNGVFVALFFNTGILITLTNANFTDVSSVLANIFHGTYYDYSPKWYATIGSTLVSTMLLNAFMPPIFEGIGNATCWLTQTLDNGCKCCKPKNERIYSTKTNQIYKYMDVYSGPNYIIHYKYSGVLNIAYVTMLYGMGLPMLFPIAFLSFFILYTTERYQIAYTYQMPPAMDDKMTENAIRLLSYTPIIFLINSYWMLSNRQMFDNVINMIPFSTQEMQSAHGLGVMGEIT